MRYGYFDDKSREYVINRPDIPVSWTNYLGVRNMCTVISHNAGGYTFYKSAQNRRITRFRPNGVPLDRPGHYIYLRDDDSGVYWSISWQPVGVDLGKAQYEVRHGLSYSRFICDYLNIHAEQALFIPVDDDVELWDVKIKNMGGPDRTISLFSYLEFSFQQVDIDNQDFQMSLYACGSSYNEGIIEYDSFYEPDTYHYLTSNFEPDSYDCKRDIFIGHYRTETNPIAVERGSCSNSSELGGNHCGALHKRLKLKPNQEIRLLFMLGVGSRKSGLKTKQKYANFLTVDQAFETLRDYWGKKTSVFQCQTPNQGLNTMTNTWTLYQAETCVNWSRFASFIEVGGRTGLGYRDTSQDVMGVVHTYPEKCKQRILQLLHGLTKAGYGLHLFDPEVFKSKGKKPSDIKLPTLAATAKAQDLVHGLEDACADDALWLVPSICEFVKETGDTDFFLEVVPYADGGKGTVYEHMTKILDFSAEHVGPHGICHGLRADWNDCLNLGSGESGMVTFILYWALKIFIEAAQYTGNDHDAQKYAHTAEKIKMASEDTLWDGQWYIRGFTQEGTKIGTHRHKEGKLFLNPQSWAVCSGLANRERGQMSMDAVDTHLYSKYGLHLLWPAYSRPDSNIGFITRVYRGLKENGSIFSHPNAWAVIAECILGRGNRAMKLYDAICPYTQNDIIQIREAEPYSYCQFVVGRDHTAHGRARHPWLTGTASWFYIAATQWILGIRLTFDGLIIDPCIPDYWQGFQILRKWRNADFHIMVKNPSGVEKGVRSITMNGKSVACPIPPRPAGSVNEIEVIMG